ncbi:MAG: hypothetical protein UE295_06825 [Acutalibacteraceae bacterium]|nr:hypothetical protein [Acutalibacteraceae bacterium]
MRIETDSDYYYDTLNIYERIRLELLEKYKSLYSASLIFGMSEAYFYQTNCIGTVNKLLRICKEMNIDFDWAITGKNNHHQFIPRELDFNKLISVYEEHKYSGRTSNSVKSIISGLRTKVKKNIKIATLLYLADMFKVSPVDII